MQKRGKNTFYAWVYQKLRSKTKERSEIIKKRQEKDTIVKRQNIEKK